MAALSCDPTSDHLTRNRCFDNEPVINSVEVKPCQMINESDLFSDAAWDYYELVYTAWEPGKRWVSLSYEDRYTVRLAQEFFWQNFESQIRTEIECWEQEGWEPIQPITPSAFQLQCQEYIDRRFNSGDVVLWIATLGIALLVSLLLDRDYRRYVIYEPGEFRILMRRAKPWQPQKMP